MFFVKNNSTCCAIFAEALGYPKPKTPVNYESMSSSVNATKECDNFEFDDNLFNIDFDEIGHKKKITIKWMNYPSYFDSLFINSNILTVKVGFIYQSGMKLFKSKYIYIYIYIYCAWARVQP